MRLKAFSKQNLVQILYSIRSELIIFKNTKEEMENKANTNQDLNSFSLSSQISEMKLEESWGKSGRSSRTLIKVGAMRLVLNAMKAGTEIKTHHATGPISVHCIEGKLKFNTEERTVTLQKGELLTLEELVKHSVEAIEETVFLLTVALSPTSASEH